MLMISDEDIIEINEKIGNFNIKNGKEPFDFNESRIS